MANPTFGVEQIVLGDGYRCGMRIYPNPGAPAQIVCLHGIQSHAVWYEHSCQRLCQAGYEVVFVDRRGSGMNGQARGDTPSFPCLLDDLAILLRRLPPRPTVLLALSWGGKLAVALQYRHPGLVDGLILVCPGFYPKVRPASATRRAILWSRLFAPTRRYPIPLNDPELFTESPTWQQFLRTDPLSLHEATARFLVESVRLDRYVRKAVPACRLPVLLQLAGRDRIIDNNATRRLIASFPTTDQRIVLYPDAAHTLEFEPDPGQHIDDQLHWLKRRWPIA